MIDSMIDSDSLDTNNGYCVLINCVAFNDKWKDKFKDIYIHDDQSFYNIEGKSDSCTLMYDKYKNENYLESEDIKATGFVKQYKSGYKFIAMLPFDDGIDGINYTLNNLNRDTYDNFLCPVEGDYELTTALPEFKFDNTINMNTVLKSMGLSGLLSNADYSNVSDDGNLDHIDMLHKAVIELDANGTKAAAATSIYMGAGAVIDHTKPKEYSVILNRPFIFVIADKSNDPIFIGVVKGIQ